MDSHNLGEISGQFFRRYTEYQQDRKNDPQWLKDQRQLEEQYAGFEQDTPFKGAMKGAKEAVETICKTDPKLAATTAMEVYQKTKVPPETVGNFCVGFVKGYNQKK